MNLTKISIVTVCFNAEKTIRRTIESVLRQTATNFEYIVVDGASSDKTMEVINSFGDKITKVISEKDKGIYDAMNKGIAMASGDYIGLLNADDWMPDDTISKISEAIKLDSETDIFYGNIIYHDLDGSERLLQPANVDLNHLLWRGMPVFHQTMFVKKEIYAAMPYDIKYRLLADYKFVLANFLKGTRFKYLDTTLGHFYDGGASTQNRKRALKEGHNIRLEMGFNPAKVYLSSGLRFVKTKVADLKHGR